jgi:hypothetical protein
MIRRLPEATKENDLTHRGNAQRQPMFQGSSNKEKPDQPVCLTMRLLLICVAAIPFFLVSSLFSFHTGRKASFKASIPPHISMKENLRPVERFRESKDSNKKRLDCVIHVGLFKTGTTTIQRALGWNVYENLVNDDYYFLGKTGGMANMRKEERERGTMKDVVRERRILYERI